jgi:N-glycosylase/DNA lyase
LVANTSLEKTLAIWKTIGNGFLLLSESELKKCLKNLGYRFYNLRSKYIVLARERIERIAKIVREKNEYEARERLVENIKGIGWKEASHFLRNLGFKDLAILDRHVLRVLKEFGIIDEIPKTLTKKKYLEIEAKLREIATKLKISLAELDLYLFYLATRKLPER